MVTQIETVGSESKFDIDDRIEYDTVLDENNNVKVYEQIYTVTDIVMYNDKLHYIITDDEYEYIKPVPVVDDYFQLTKREHSALEIITVFNEYNTNNSRINMHTGVRTHNIYSERRFDYNIEDESFYILQHFSLTSGESDDYYLVDVDKNLVVKLFGDWERKLYVIKQEYYGE